MTDEMLATANEWFKMRGMRDPVFMHALPAMGGFIVCAEGVRDHRGTKVRDWLEVSVNEAKA